MKIRTGFVSNSSSSSFVCDVCAYSEAGWDGQYDIQVVRCQNGHEMCEEHVDIPEKITEENKQELFNYIKEYCPTEKCPKIDESLDELQSWWAKTRRWLFSEGIDAKDCPICNLSVVKDGEIVKHLLEKYDLSRKSVEEEIRKGAKNEG